MSSTLHPNELKKVVKMDLTKYQELFSREGQSYLTMLQNRLAGAKNQRDAIKEEFGGVSYVEYYTENEKLANTWIGAKKNEDDVKISSGSVEAKLDTVLANVNGLNLSPEIVAYDDASTKLIEFGQAIEDTLLKTEELDDDEEKKMLRQRELLKQGTVFVQERWLKKFETKKKLKGKFDGSFSGVKWSEKLEQVFDGPSRELLYGPNVFLGDVTEFYMKDQPYIFVAVTTSYQNAKKQFGKFENFKFVTPGKVEFSDETDAQGTLYDATFRLQDIEDNQVEILYYQDQPNDEFQIIINGIVMMPIGFPLSAITPKGEYNVTKQVYRVIHPKFAYGSSFVSAGSIQYISRLIDEMLKLFVLKTRKSFSPPYVNVSGRVISPRVLSPGKITMGITSDALQKIGEEGNGVTNAEFAVLRELQNRIDQSTVSPIFAGQQAKSGTTATEILEVQRQAKVTLGLTITVCSLLEKKLAQLRVDNIVNKWFDPTDTRFTTVNDFRKFMKGHRAVSVDAGVAGEGLGIRQTIPVTGGLPTSREVQEMEAEQARRVGLPTKMVFIDADMIAKTDLYFKITVRPRETETSAARKLMFREKMVNMLALLQMGSRPNLSELEDDFARTYGVSRDKIFSAQQQQGQVTQTPGEENVSPALQQALALGRPSGGEIGPQLLEDVA